MKHRGMKECSEKISFRVREEEKSGAKAVVWKENGWEFPKLMKYIHRIKNPN